MILMTQEIQMGQEVRTAAGNDYSKALGESALHR